jgi:hypothetical protein
MGLNLLFASVAMAALFGLLATAIGPFTGASPSIWLMNAVLGFVALLLLPLVNRVRYAVRVTMEMNR